jgi:hypothetical protein
VKRHKFKIQPTAGPRGFSAWIPPNPYRYMMECCDCALVHEIQFKAIKTTKVRADGMFKYKELPRTTHRVLMRVRRAEKYTERQRKKRRAAASVKGGEKPCR